MEKIIKVFLSYLIFVCALIFVSCSESETEKSVAAKPESATREKRAETKPGEEVFKVDVGTSISRGPADAPATIVVFSDFQCPFSKKSVDMIEELMKKYDGKVRYVFKHFPLGFHKFAKQASFAAIAAQNQDKFWEYYAKLYEDVKRINEETILAYAQELKLDMDKFNADRVSKETAEIVRRDVFLGSNFGVRGTPTLFVNGVKIVGANNKKLEDVVIRQIALGEQIKAKGVKDPYFELVKNGLTKFVPLKREPPVVPADVYKVEIPSRVPIWGGDDALATIILIADFECPFCGRLYGTYEQIKKEYGHKIRVAFINFPLPFHQKAKTAALAALAAQKQGKFWEMYEILFTAQKEWGAVDDLQKWLEEKAASLQLDVAKFKKDTESQALKNVIDSDIKFTESIGVRAAPSSFINGRFVSGALPFESFKKVIDEEIKKAEALRANNLKGDLLYREIIKNGKPKVIKIERERKKQENPDKIYDVVLSGKEPTKGAKNAKITIVEFSEHQCPFCKKAAETVESVLADYKNDVKLVFKHLPLAFHKEAKPAALFTIAIKNLYGDDKFFAASRLLFDKQNEWKQDSTRKFELYAKNLNLDWNKIKTEMARPETALILKTDIDEASKHALRGAPTFFVNGKKTSGAKSKEYFKALIDNMLKENGR